LSSASLKVVSAEEARLPDVEEDGATFEENASKKALEAAKFTGLPALADDSGLVVDCLDGEPGVRSARYAGEDATDDDNNRLLTGRLEKTGLPLQKRTGRFVCVFALATPDGEVHTVRGEAEGQILTEPKGENGFGYDPFFFYPEWGKTFAEVDRDKKGEVSHRGKALRKIVDVILKTLANE